MIEAGQVLSLKMRFNNSGMVSQKKHPYLVVGINNEFGTVEIAQMDSLEGKEYKAAMKSNKVIYYNDPDETVIDKDSYIQMDNTFLLENHVELEKYRRQEEKLSKEKLADAIHSYEEYHRTHAIDEDKQVYLSINELINLQNT